MVSKLKHNFAVLFDRLCHCNSVAPRVCCSVIGAGINSHFFVSLPQCLSLNGVFVEESIKRYSSRVSYTVRNIISCSYSLFLTYGSNADLYNWITSAKPVLLRFRMIVTAITAKTIGT